MNPIIAHPLDRHVVLLEREEVNKHLWVRSEDASPILLNDYIKTMPPGIDGEGWTRNVNSSSDPEGSAVEISKIDLTDAFTLMSPRQYSKHAWIEDYYLPSISLTIADTQGQVYDRTIYSPLFGSAINYDRERRSGEPHFSLQSIVFSLLHPCLSSLVKSSLSPVDGPLYTTRDIRYGEISHTFVLGQGADNKLSHILMFHVIAILKKPLEPSIMHHDRAASLTAENPALKLEARTLIPKPYQALKARFDKMDVIKVAEPVDALIRAPIFALKEDWFDRIKATHFPDV